MTSVLREESASSRDEPSLGHFFPRALSQADGGPMQMRSLEESGADFQVISQMCRSRWADTVPITWRDHDDACFMSRGQGIV
jgi:hypothetical protein